MHNPIIPILLLAAALLPAGQVTVAWDPNTEPDLAGYRVHYGPASRQYTVSIDVGLVTTYTIKGLEIDTLYFSAVTAYNQAELESGYSNEISFHPNPSPPDPPGGYRLQVNLQSSTDLRHWETVAVYTPASAAEFFRFTIAPRDP